MMLPARGGDSPRHHPKGIAFCRHSFRLRGYDYSQNGAYFVTLCTQNRDALFGEIVDGDVHLNECGQIVVAHWRNIPRHFPNVELDAFVIMPNHLHGIIVITGAPAASTLVGAKHSPKFANASPLQPRGTSPCSLGAIIQNFKSVSSRKINQARDAQGSTIWQRNYYEHIIRNERESNAIAEYIRNNPANWASDVDNAANCIRHSTAKPADRYWRDASH